MLTKLIKHDLKFIYKQLFIFYIIVFLMALIARVTNVENPIFIVRFIHEFAQGSALGFAFGMFINASIRTWARFRQNLYGDESYLTHTLPIKRSTLWTSKFITSLIVTGVTLLTLLLCFFILFFETNMFNIEALKANGVYPEIWWTIVLCSIAMFCQFSFIMQCGSTGIILGHRRNSKPILFSVIYGLITYFVSSLLLIGLIMLWTVLSPTIHDVIFNGVILNLGTLNLIFGTISIMYIALISVAFFLDRKMLNRGVNVD